MPILTPCIDAGIYAGFVDLLPRSIVDQQLVALLGDPSQAIDTLAQAAQDGDYGQVAQLAHQLKGTCMVMGFSAMTATIAQIEAACERSPADVKAINAISSLSASQELSSLLAQLQRDRAHTLAALPPSSGVPTLAR